MGQIGVTVLTLLTCHGMLATTSLNTGSMCHLKNITFMTQQVQAILSHSGGEMTSTLSITQDGRKLTTGLSCNPFSWRAKYMLRTVPLSWSVGQQTPDIEATLFDLRQNMVDFNI